MKYTKPIFSIIGSGIISSSISAEVVAKVVAQRPNVIFILADDHAKTAISAYGGINSALAPTPNIDKIANEGVMFNNMFCTNSISGPSRACLITGKYSNVNGFYQNEGGIVFDNSQPTIATILQSNGYNTALIGKWHLFSEPKGFDFYKIHANQSQQGTYWNPLFDTNGKKAIEKGYATNITSNSAIEWMKNRRQKDKPFLLLLNFKAPHRPWEPDSIYQHLFDSVQFQFPETFNDDYNTREKTAGKSMATISKDLSRLDLKQIPPAEMNENEQREWLKFGGTGENQLWTPDKKLEGQALKNWKFQQYIKDYLRCVRSVDDNVGKVLEFLKANGLDENTLIIYMGDQGFFLGEHGWFDKRWMYEESFQMPCLIRFPKQIKPAEKINDFAINVDIAPTILDYAGLEIPKDIQGESLRALLEQDKNKTKNWRKSVYYQYFEYPKWHNVLPHYGIRTEKFKLIHFYFTDDMWEFYDLAKDPNELTNQYHNPTYQQAIKQLKEELKMLQKKYKDDMPIKERKEMTKKFSVKY